jgi:hypothetical protein
MTAQSTMMDCNIYKSAFSGEVVFAVETDNGTYEGVAPKHYARFNEGELSEETPHKGSLQVKMISNGGDKAQVATPDGEVISVQVGIIKK